MKKTIAAVIIPLLILSFSGITSCNSCQNRSDKNENRVMKDQKNIIESEIQKNVYPLPTSAEVIKMLTDLEVGYNLGISNDVDNAKKYYTSAARSINLGVYGADLSYATLYNMDQKVYDYMDAIRTIANDLNMAKIYNAPLYDSIKKNFDNRDKLVKILTGAFDDTYAYMSDNEQQVFALLMVGGAWVEGMYLTCNVNEAAYSVYGISKVLIEQKKSFDLFIDITKPYLEDPILGDFVKTLEPIKNVYAGLTTSLTDQNIKDITAAMTIIRNKIVTP
jgi:hypothetical protein